MANYNTRLIKAKRSYSISEMASLFGINIKTGNRWLQDGLKPIDSKEGLTLVMGASLISFLKTKKAKKKITLKYNELFCLKCQKAVIARVGSEKIEKTGNKIGKNNSDQYIKRANCEECGTRINRLLGAYQRD